MAEVVDDEDSPEDKTSGAEVPNVPSEIKELTRETYENYLSEGMHLVQFYAPWCGHCKRLSPVWQELNEVFRDNTEINISQVDCTNNGSVCRQYQIKGYPTVLWIENGKRIEKYYGRRTVEDLQNYAEKKASHIQDPIYVNENIKNVEENDMLSKVIQLRSNNFQEAIKSGTVFVKFFAPWCGYSKILAPVWIRLAQKRASDNIKIAEVDCTLAENEQLCNDEVIQGYPTLILYKNGKRIREYYGPRHIGDLSVFLKRYTNDDEMAR